jgi:hypothetical protein
MRPTDLAQRRGGFLRAATPAADQDSDGLIDPRCASELERNPVSLATVMGPV